MKLNRLESGIIGLIVFIIMIALAIMAFKTSGTLKEIKEIESKNKQLENKIAQIEVDKSKLKNKIAKDEQSRLEDIKKNDLIIAEYHADSKDKKKTIEALRKRLKIKDKLTASDQSYFQCIAIHGK